MPREIKPCGHLAHVTPVCIEPADQCRGCFGGNAGERPEPRGTRCGRTLVEILGRQYPEVREHLGNGGGQNRGEPRVVAELFFKEAGRKF